jgi:hypothetical protein
LVRFHTWRISAGVVEGRAQLLETVIAEARELLARFPVLRSKLEIQKRSKTRAATVRN